MGEFLYHDCVEAERNGCLELLWPLVCVKRHDHGQLSLIKFAETSHNKARPMLKNSF